MSTLVSDVIATKNTPSVHVVILGLLTTFTMERLSEVQRTMRDGLPRIVAYALLVGLVFAVTIDLEQPCRG
jgi:hypothetical protein